VLHELFVIVGVFTYVSLALRENILRYNGTRIDFWWIRHHYFAAIALLLSIACLHHEDENIQGMLHYANVFFVFLGVVRYLQTMYQR